MKNLIILVLSSLVSLISFAQNNTAKVDVFARYAYINNIAQDIPPTLNVLQTGASISWKKNTVEAVGMYNLTLDRFGTALYYKRGLFKKPLGKGFGIGSQLITEAAVFPSKHSQNLTSGAVGVGMGIKKTFGPVSITVANAGFAKVLYIQAVDDIKYLGEYRLLTSISYKF